MGCSRCNDKKVIFIGNSLQRCLCVREEEIIKRIQKRVAGEVKFVKPTDIDKFEDVLFLQLDLNIFKHYLAGYLIHKPRLSFDIMTASQFFDYRLSDSDNDLLLKPDIFILSFPSIFFNRAAPYSIMQLCEERKLAGKKTWIVSSVPRHELEIGFRESKETFGNYLDGIPVRKLHKGQFKKLKGGSSDPAELQKTWKATL